VSFIVSSHVLACPVFAVGLDGKSGTGEQRLQAHERTEALKTLAEAAAAPTVPNQHHRAGDLADPLWGLLDMTPEGRGDFFPKVNYD
jgi:predicted dithiol-disulfide oxidoreductase (DUF899 family)